VPVFHFNTSNGANFSDVDGTEFNSVAAAKLEATRHVGEMLVDKSTRDEKVDDLRLDVTDDRGLVLFSLLVSMIDAPALRTLDRPT